MDMFTFRPVIMVAIGPLRLGNFLARTAAIPTTQEPSAIRRETHGHDGRDVQVGGLVDDALGDDAAPLVDDGEK